MMTQPKLEKKERKEHDETAWMRPDKTIAKCLITFTCENVKLIFRLLLL
jgi:hypothetical protein